MWYRYQQKNWGITQFLTVLVLLSITACSDGGPAVPENAPLPTNTVILPNTPVPTNTVAPTNTAEPTEVPIVENKCGESDIPVGDSAPGEVTVYDPDKAYHGLTMYMSREENRAIIIDMQGRETFSFQMQPVNEFTSLGVIKPLVDQSFFFIFYLPYKERPSLGMLVEADIDGNVLWEWDGGKGLRRIHHDFINLENGNILAIVSPQPDEVYPEIRQDPIRNDLIVEINPDGDIVWEWSTAEHYDQLPLTDEDRQIIATKDFGDTPFRFHTNSIQVLPPNRLEADYPAFAAGNILVSQRWINAVYIIDKDTGDIVWFSEVDHVGQHQPRMIPEELPGAGNILIFDNGIIANGIKEEDIKRSRIIEIDPITQSIVWSYDAMMSDQSVGDFYSRSRGGMQRLPNGNTLIAEATTGRIFEVTIEGEIVWEYIYETERGFYRAIRLEFDWACGGSPDFLVP